MQLFVPETAFKKINNNNNFTNMFGVFVKSNICCDQLINWFSNLLRATIVY